ncbi:MAG: hypothetical protein WB014_12985 [Methanosarcina sp.]
MSIDVLPFIVSICRFARRISWGSMSVTLPGVCGGPKGHVACRRSRSCSGGSRPIKLGITSVSEPWLGGYFCFLNLIFRSGLLIDRKACRSPLAHGTLAEVRTDPRIME